MIVFELDIPLLTEQGIEMGKSIFEGAEDIVVIGMIDWLIDDWDVPDIGPIGPYIIEYMFVRCLTL